MRFKFGFSQAFAGDGVRWG